MGSDDGTAFNCLATILVLLLCFDAPLRFTIDSSFLLEMYILGLPPSE